MNRKMIACGLILMLCCTLCVAQAFGESYPEPLVVGDAIAGSPALAARGDQAIGVRTLEVKNPGQLNLAASTDSDPYPVYDRPLTLEIWYPAVVAEGAPGATYTDFMGRVDLGNLEGFDYAGRAVRDSEPDLAGGPYPVVVVSHGYPGSRMLMSYLGENLATKGYVVVSIGHTDNTYEDFASFALYSALINRSLDQRFVVAELSNLNAEGWAKGLLDTENVGLIGYSMGGYGAYRTLGATMSEGTLGQFAKYADYLKEAEDYKGDKAVKAAVLFAPAMANMLAPESFVNIDVPSLWIVGTADTTVGYEAVKDVYASCVNSDRYFLTYENLGHNVGPNPAPAVAQAAAWEIAKRWADPVWDTWRLNAINCHFITAFLDAQLKGEADKLDYLNVAVANGNEAVYSVDKEGNFTPEHTYWPGFVASTSVGLILEHLDAQ